MRKQNFWTLKMIKQLIEGKNEIVVADAVCGTEDGWVSLPASLPALPVWLLICSCKCNHFSSSWLSPSVFVTKDIPAHRFKVLFFLLLGLLFFIRKQNKNPGIKTVGLENCWVWMKSKASDIRMYFIGSNQALSMPNKYKKAFHAVRCILK